MTEDDRVRLRAALRIHARLSGAGTPPPPRLPLDAWRGLERAARLNALAAERGWTAAAAAARSEYRRRAAELTDRLAACLRSLDTEDGPRAVQSAGEVLADLAALEAEFVEVEIDPKECTVSVTTDPVTLEGVRLGPFELAWRWDLPPDSGSYSVIALDPNPAAESESTTHPHVREEALCEGDGRVPIRRALEQGRLLDFFLLVRGVLTTYNPGSAYVPLERWSGSPCADCGETPSEEESACCDRCHADLCTDCVTTCAACDRLCCSGCRTRCGGCEEPSCEICLSPCRRCGGDHCAGCLDGGLCGDCREPEPDPELPEETDDPPTPVPDLEDTPAAGPPAEAAAAPEPAGPAVHPLRLGEAAAPA